MIETMAKSTEQPEGESRIARVRRSVMAGITSGAFRSADRLPSEREFASQLKVSRTTVTAAYADLEQKGIIRRLQGKGAFFCALPTERESFSWSGKISRTANALDEPVLELLARRCAGDLPYPLSAGTPSLEVFPKEAYRTSVERVLTEEMPGVLAVAPTEGQWRLRQAIGSWMGVNAHQVLVTAGAQEGIDLLARCLIEQGDSVVVDAPTYPGAIQSFRSAGAQMVPWNTDWSLVQMERLLLRSRPKLIFTTPTFQNPTGRVMGLKTRLGLLELAHRYRVPVLEDDVYGRTAFGPHGVPESLYALDTHLQVISISTFSKILAPGLRLGWVLAPSYMVKQLALIKMRSNLFTGGLNQIALAELLETGEMDRHLLRLREHHGRLCRAAMEALQPAVDAGLLRYRAPEGSLYLWCKVLFPVDADLLFSTMEARGVSVAPGVAFEPVPTEPVHFRVCFTAADAVTTAGGLRVIAAVLEEMARAGAPATDATRTMRDPA